MSGIMQYILCGLAALIVCRFPLYADKSSTAMKDRYLVVPGLGAENLLLGEEVERVLSLFGYPDKSVESKEEMELLLDVYGRDLSLQIHFDKIFIYEMKAVIVFFKRGRISAVAGLSKYRVTSDSVNLARGVEYFLFNYGNKYLHVLEMGENKMYIYSRFGIAIIDDLCDDIIDMYIVFPSRQRVSNLERAN